jgi:mono/diheme cytochrome c family protein
MPRWLIPIIVACLSGAAVAFGSDDEPTLPPAAKQRIDFQRDIAPLLQKHCLTCHGPKLQKSGFRLDNPAAALKGGDMGQAIVPGKSADSPLIHNIAGVGAFTMPPKGPRLSNVEIGLLRAWIDQGANFPADYGKSLDGSDWWSLQPLARPTVPKVEATSFPIRNPIDAFVLARLVAANLKPAPEADRRTLMRRLYFDLIGLPPDPDEVDRFVADPDPQAYEKLVDRLLASPHYGERWARHWLDVVHYGDTHGYDKDKPRPNAWPYRDYVIRSFNADKPYSRFVQEQLAGDVLFPGEPEGVEALGFIAAGPWDFIAHVEVPETKIDGKIARHLDRDDMVANTLNTFCSVTVQCAQCHDHKFDPIPQEDYYRLQAVFAALDRADKKYWPDAATARKADALEKQHAALKHRQQEIARPIAAQGGTKLAELDRRVAVAEAAARLPKQPPEYGYHSLIEPAADRPKWVQVDLGQATEISRIEVIGCFDNFAGIGFGFGFPRRYKIEACDEPEFARQVKLLVDRTGELQKNPGVDPLSFPVNVTARYVRFTATMLAERANDYILAVAELRVFDAANRNVAAGVGVTALDSTELPPRWRKANLVDGIVPNKLDPAAQAEVARRKEAREEYLEKNVDATLLAARASLAAELAAVEVEQAKLPMPKLVYAGTVHHGIAPFRGTGPDGGVPRGIFILERGDVRKPGKEVGPGALSAVKPLAPEFGPPRRRHEGERRAALARWITDPNNPLTWRSIVNRIWRYHFGRGIVDSPNDFGRMGQLPTHPELLDWLAVAFRDGGQSFKTLHRLMVTSSTYRRSSHFDQACAMQDADNALYWRMPRRKLEAEAVRDSVLAVSGKLDRRLYGPAFQDFTIEKPDHSPHYQYHHHDPDDPRTHRRSIYRFLVRSQQQPFMTALDCADPSMQVDKRNETLSALQALALLNDGFMLTMARHFAARVEKEGGEPGTKAKRAFRLALGRDPTPKELTELTAYTRLHGLANACRLLFNLNEFVFVD